MAIPTVLRGSAVAGDLIRHVDHAIEICGCGLMAI